MTLFTALSLLALAVLAGLGAHGWWQARRLRPRPPAAAEPAHSGFRVEPSLAPRPADTAFADTDPAPLAGDADPPGRRAATRRVPRLDALIDALVPLKLESPVSAEMVLSHMPPTRRVGSKPFYVEGLDAETGEWEPLTAGHRYGELQAGVQLANRGGALNEIEYSEFLQKVESFAQAVGATAEPPDMLEVVARARELDSLTSPLDAQLNVTLRSNGVAWSVAFLQQLAGRLGFVPGAVPGRLVLPAAEKGAPPVLALTFSAQAALAEDPQTSAVRECTLMLDVPQTPETVEPFPLFHLTATSLAADLDATTVDNAGQPITLHAYAAIGQELTQLYRQLGTLDLAAGSPAARRLFS